MAYGLEKIVPEDTEIYQQLTNYYKYCERRRMSPKTMQWKTYCINRFVKFSKITCLEDITNQQVDDWIDSMIARDNTGRTINLHLYQLQAMLKWQRDDNVIMPNLKLSRIAMQKEVPPRKVFFTREEINKALSMADRREWLWIKLSFDCGLRISELHNIRLKDISGKKIRIVGKGSKLRFVIMSDEARERLSDWIEREQITDYLWIERTEPKLLQTQTIRVAMKKVFHKAGFDDFRPHDLRHSFATELKQLGVPTRQIQAGMGHSSEAITERYLSDLDGFNIEEIYNVKFAVQEVLR